MSVTVPPPVQPQDGVIKDARRRRFQRRRRATIAVLFLAGLAAAGWLLDGGSSGAVTKAPRSLATAAAQRAERVPFNIRMYPAFEVGQAGFCFAIEEQGVTGGSACGDQPLSSTPLTMVFGGGSPSSGIWTTVAVTLPQVTSVLVNGTRRVPTTIVPGLPFGLRAVRIVTRTKKWPPPRSAHRLLASIPVLVPLDAAGERLAQHNIRTTQMARTMKWSRPQHAPRGACELKASGLPGLRATGGAVAGGIHTLSGVIVGAGFMPCIETRYLLAGEPVRALILLNAADPTAPAGALPNFKPVPGESGFYTEGGALTATRAGNDWLVVGQATSPKQRLEVLRHLRATTHL